MTSRSRLSWLSLFIPLGYLPGYFFGSSPGIGGALAILVATGAAWFLVDRLARPKSRTMTAVPIMAPVARPPAGGGTSYLPSFNPHAAPSGEPPTGRLARTAGGGAAPLPQQTPVVSYAESPASRPLVLPGWMNAVAWPLALTLGAWIFASIVAGGSMGRVAALGRKEAFSVGIFQQALWWTNHGIPMGVTYATSDASLHRQFGIHFSPLFTLLAPLYKMRPETSTLLWMQALALGLAALPLYAAAKLRIGRMGAGLVAIAWWLHPTILGTPLLGFHDLAFVPLFAFTAFWALGKRRWLPYAVALVALLLVREDLAFFVFLMAFVAAASNAESRFVMTPVLFGIGWAVAAFMYLMPHYRTATLLAGPQIFMGQYFGEWGGTASTAFGHLVTHPLDVLHRLTSRESLLYVASILRPTGFLIPLPDPSWIVGLQNLGLNVLSDGNALKSPLARYSIPVVVGFFMALPGALARWGGWLGSPVVEEDLARGGVEERGAALRAASKIGDLWNTRNKPKVPLALAGRAGAPAAAVVVVAAALSIFLMRVDRQFGSTPRRDLADQLAVLNAVPDSVAVLAPDYAYAHLANRATFACLGSLEGRALEPEVLGKFDAILLDMAPESFETQKYGDIQRQIEMRVRGDATYRETLSAGGLHLFERLNTHRM